MQSQVEVVNNQLASGPVVEERAYPAWEGFAVLAGSVVAVGAGIAILGTIHDPGGILGGILLLIIGLLGVTGLTAIKPGEVRVVQLFGGYRGSVRRTGLCWVNPFAVRRRISVRIRNKETPTVKVNDSDGNPIEIAAVVVWMVRDSALATYSVEDYVAFVDIQSETALRHVANSHSYDRSDPDVLSLRDHTDEVAGQLAAEIAARVIPAGVDIIEARITRLSYAPEIAQVMLQRQQASAVVAARSRIVEGAVGMVQMALERLADQDIVELDEERKAAMVSNLLVVLCGDRGTQPIVNAGSLYH
ncbi:MAG TPA: SPFH domain-containing protein [Acidimicrobiales bacterium]|jgi:regulator of protease activity HflC (stomatin/prohibitin superfamily)|nr:SPFH domain-containing protein [Acidimicrobiales bacterium]